MHHSFRGRSRPQGQQNPRQQESPSQVPPVVDSWIMDLPPQELIARLRSMNANTEGTLPVLRDRLSRAIRRREFNVTWHPEDDAQSPAAGQGTSAMADGSVYRDPSIINISTTGLPRTATTGGNPVYTVAQGGQSGRIS